MKKLFAIIIVMFVACNGDDNTPTPQPPTSTIFGKWYHKNISVNGIVVPYDDHEACGKDYIEFYDENKIRSIDIWDCEEDLDWVGSFVKEGNNLTISNGSESRTVEITELTTNNLSYKYSFDEDGDGEDENYIERFDR